MNIDLDLPDFAESAFWSRKIRESQWPPDPVGSALKVSDIFSGCGGLTMGTLLAAHALNRSISIELAVDSWSSAMDVYSENFGHLTKKLICGDVKKVMKSFKICDLDVVVAGPPCQGHSDLNNSTRRIDERNELYIFPASFAIKHSARILLIENVPAVVHSAQKVVSRAEKKLIKAGYVTAQIVVDTSNFGIPQKRKRHLLIGSKSHDSKNLFAITDRILSYRSSPKVMDFIDDLEDFYDNSELLMRISKVNRSRID